MRKLAMISGFLCFPLALCGLCFSLWLRHHLLDARAEVAQLRDQIATMTVQLRAETNQHRIFAAAAGSCAAMMDSQAKTTK